MFIFLFYLLYFGLSMKVETHNVKKLNPPLLLSNFYFDSECVKMYYCSCKSL